MKNINPRATVFIGFLTCIGQLRGNWVEGCAWGLGIVLFASFCDHWSNYWSKHK